METKQPIACPSALCDLDADDAPPAAEPLRITKCLNCRRDNFIIINGEVCCPSCGMKQGLSVVTTDVVQQLRTSMAEKNQSLITLLELLLPFTEEIGKMLPLAKPQMTTMANAIKAKLLELKL
jgi:hypothetical protein